MDPTASWLWRIAGEAAALALRGAPGYEAHLTPTAWLVLSGEPVADFNIALIDQGLEAAARLRDFGQVLQARQLPALVCLTEAVADQLAPTAREVGLHEAARLPLMVYRSAGERRAAPPSLYEIEQVRAAPVLGEVNDVLARAFGVPLDALNRAAGPPLLEAPGATVFLARQAGQPISTVATFRAGATVSIWSMGTVPEQQRQGAGRALLEHVVAQHGAQGVTHFFLWATAAGKPLYERVGFHTLAEAAVWAAGPSAQFPGH